MWGRPVGARKWEGGCWRSGGCTCKPINYPTVPKGHERFRLTPSRLHTPEMVEKRVEGLLAV